MLSIRCRNHGLKLVPDGAAAGASLENHEGVRGYVIDMTAPESETTTHCSRGMARNFDFDEGGVRVRRVIDRLIVGGAAS